MLRITISVEQWDITGDITRETFDDYITTIICPYLQNREQISKTVITFPRSVSKIERYNIHKLSNSEFKSMSYDNHLEDRILEVTLSKKYVQELFSDYVFWTPVQPISPEEIEPQKTDKQILLDTLIEFIETNLGDEFKEYLSTI